MRNKGVETPSLRETSAEAAPSRFPKPERDRAIPAPVPPSSSAASAAVPTAAGSSGAPAAREASQRNRAADEAARDAAVEARWNEVSGAEARQSELDELYASMFNGKDFLFTVTREEVRRITSPLLVLMGKDIYHPSQIAREVASLATNAELIESWRDDDASLAVAASRIGAFLEDHTPPGTDKEL